MPTLIGGLYFGSEPDRTLERRFASTKMQVASSIIKDAHRNLLRAHHKKQASRQSQAFTENHFCNILCYMAMARGKATHPAFDLLGSEARTRVAFAFIPDPGSDVTSPQLSALLDKPQASLNDSIYALQFRGLLEQGVPNETGPRTFRRVDHPMWAVYEAAKIAFGELGVEIRSIVE